MPIRTMSLARPSGRYSVAIDTASNFACCRLSERAVGTLHRRGALVSRALPAWRAFDTSGAEVGSGFAYAFDAFRAMVDHHAAGAPELPASHGCPGPHRTPRLTSANRTRIAALVSRAELEARHHLAHNPSDHGRMGILVQWKGNVYVARVRSAVLGGMHLTHSVLFG